MTLHLKSQFVRRHRARHRDLSAIIDLLAGDPSLPGLNRAMHVVLKDDTELFKRFSDNGPFNKRLSDSIFAAT